MAGCGRASRALPGIGSSGKGAAVAGLDAELQHGLMPGTTAWQHPEPTSSSDPHSPHISRWSSGDPPSQGLVLGLVAQRQCNPALSQWWESVAKMASPASAHPWWGHPGLNEASLNKAAFLTHTVLPQPAPLAEAAWCCSLPFRLQPRR